MKTLFEPIASTLNPERLEIYRRAVAFHGDPSFIVGDGVVRKTFGFDETLFRETLHDVEDELTNNAKFKYAGLVALREIKRIQKS